MSVYRIRQMVTGTHKANKQKQTVKSLEKSVNKTANEHRGSRTSSFVLLEMTFSQSPIILRIAAK